MTATQRIEVVTLPKTEAEIKAQFSGATNAALRKEIRAACLSSGTCLGLSRRIGLTAGGVAGLKAVDQVAREEFSAKGYARVFVGDRDHNDSTQVAYLDQPHQTSE